MSVVLVMMTIVWGGSLVFVLWNIFQESGALPKVLPEILPGLKKPEPKFSELENPWWQIQVQEYQEMRA